MITMYQGLTFRVRFRRAARLAAVRLRLAWLRLGYALRFAAGWRP